MNTPRTVARMAAALAFCFGFPAAAFCFQGNSSALPSALESTSFSSIHSSLPLPPPPGLNLFSCGPWLDAIALRHPESFDRETAASLPNSVPPQEPVDRESSFCLGTVSNLTTAAMSKMSTFGDVLHYEPELHRSGNTLPLIAGGAAVALLGLQIVRRHHRRWRY